jgi:hypothetical protein
VTLLQREFGFSRVMLANGNTGYVATDELRPVAEAPANMTSRKSERSSSGPAKRSNVSPTPGEPLFDVNDVPLPMGEMPAAKPSPGDD